MVVFSKCGGYSSNANINLVRQGANPTTVPFCGQKLSRLSPVTSNLLFNQEIIMTAGNIAIQKNGSLNPLSTVMTPFPTCPVTGSTQLTFSIDPGSSMYGWVINGIGPVFSSDNGTASIQFHQNAVTLSSENGCTSPASNSFPLGMNVTSIQVTVTPGTSNSPLWIDVWFWDSQAKGNGFSQRFPVTFG